jgi:hypothetical protein
MPNWPLAQAGKALPAHPFGMLARIGSVGAHRLPLPVRLLRTAPDVPSEAALWPIEQWPLSDKQMVGARLFDPFGQTVLCFLERLYSRRELPVASRQAMPRPLRQRASGTMERLPRSDVRS